VVFLNNVSHQAHETLMRLVRDNLHESARRVELEPMTGQAQPDGLVLF
jgi:hypothetical protein